MSCEWYKRCDSAGLNWLLVEANLSNLKCREMESEQRKFLAVKWKTWGRGEKGRGEGLCRLSTSAANDEDQSIFSP